MRAIALPAPGARAAGTAFLDEVALDWAGGTEQGPPAILIPPMKVPAFTTFPTSPLNQASAARRGLPHSSPPRPTTGPSRSSVVRRSIVGSATRTGIEENVPAGVVTS